MFVKGEGVYFEELKENEIEQALHLADECVGKNLYSYEDFSNAINNKDKFFFFLKNEEGKIAGYIYFLITSSKEALSSVDLNVKDIPFSERCGKIQSVALSEEYRGECLASQMIDFAIKTLSEKGIDLVYIICWKPGGFLPLKKTLDKCSFTYLVTIKDAWYKDENLICPYCKGRCHCSADIYYKRLQNPILTSQRRSCED